MKLGVYLGISGIESIRSGIVGNIIVTLGGVSGTGEGASDAWTGATLGGASGLVVVTWKIAESCCSA